MIHHITPGYISAVERILKDIFCIKNAFYAYFEVFVVILLCNI